MDTQSIVILDFGAQYTQLIARRIREQNVFSAVLPCTASLEEIQAYKPIGIVLSGGPCSVYDADAPPADPKVLDLGLPILGICYGLQFITHHLGGKVRAADKREYGHADVQIVDEKNALFDGLPSDLTVWMSHGDEALELPAGFHLTAKTANAVAGIANPEKRIWAVQFHPEVHHTRQGTALLRNFLFRICNAKADWTPAHFVQSTVAAIKEKVGDAHAICALSGGVDSSVAAVLVASRDRRSAYLRLCEQWRAAEERVLQSPTEHARQAGAECCRGRCQHALSCETRGRDRSGDEAQGDRQ